MTFHCYNSFHSTLDTYMTSGHYTSLLTGCLHVVRNVCARQHANVQFMNQYNLLRLSKRPLGNS